MLTVSSLIGELSDAIRKRSQTCPSFDLYNHIANPLDYTPVTEEELRIWGLLTSPENYSELLSHVRGRREIAMSGYALIMDVLILQAAQARNGYPTTDETLQLSSEQARRRGE